MGSGKSTLGKRFAKTVGYSFVDIDSMIINRTNLVVAQIFEKYGENYFREMEKICLLEISKMQNIVVATGGGLPCFFNNMEIMNNTGDTVYLKTSVDELFNRLQVNRLKRPLLRDKSDIELRKYIQEMLTKREPIYSQCKHILTSDNPKPEMLKTILGFAN